MEFVHLNVHSCYSFLSGVNKIEEIISQALKYKMKALALTDTNGLYAVIPFVQLCKKYQIKPIIGAELQVKNNRVLLIAKNIKGYSELSNIITQLHLNSDFQLFTALEKISDNLFIITDDIFILTNLKKNNLFVELIFDGTLHSRQNKYKLISLADKLNLPLVATNRVFFLKKEDFFVHKILTALKLKSTIGTLPTNATVSPENYFKSQEEMKELFKDVPEAIKNTVFIANSCNVELQIGKPKIPKFPTPKNETPFSLLSKIALEGLKKRYNPLTFEALQKLFKELEVVYKLDLANYFLINWDIVRYARENSMPAFGRGSAANSILSYCLYITHVDPLKHNLFFERFLNLERASYPDFDIDFATEDREKIIDYVFNKYGKKYVAMISTHVTFRARASLREVATAFGLPIDEIENLIKAIPHFADLDIPENMIKYYPTLKNIPFNKSPYKEIFTYARKINGLPRHIATHPCGIVISPVPISNLVPLQIADKGVIVTQWSMYDIEELGLLKIDLLGQKGLAVISDTFKSVKKNYPNNDFSTVNYLKDNKTLYLLKNGKTIGCFYIESPIMIQMLKQAKCSNFEVLTALSSIIRPGVSNYGGKKQYLLRHLGFEKPTYLHPKLKPILKDTYGCLIYQEQVIQVASEIAGMSLAEADGLRRCMSKKRDWEDIRNYKNRFISGAVQNGIPKKIALELFRQIESFAGYAFCKAHSASFALESFQSLYLKAHYPAEFMAAVLSNQGGYYSQLEYIEECRRLGLNILKPSVKFSHIKFSGKNNYIRIGLMQIKNLSTSAQNQIIEERNKEMFISLYDFFKRIKLSYAEALNLAKSGALDDFGFNRAQILWIVELMFKSKSKMEQLIEKIPDIPDLNIYEKMKLELETLNFTVSAPIWKLFEPKIKIIQKKRPLIKSINLPKHQGETVYIAGWLVTQKRTRTKNSNKLMEFMTLADNYNRFEVVLFPEVYENYASELIKNSPLFLVKGKVEKDLNYYYLNASNIKCIDF